MQEILQEPWNIKYMCQSNYDYTPHELQILFYLVTSQLIV